MKITTQWILALFLWIGVFLAAPLPDAAQAMRGSDDEPVAKPSPTQVELENRSLPPEIREDVEKPAPASARPLPGEADADDGATEPDAPASPVPSLAPDPDTDAPVEKPKPKPKKASKSKIPGATVKKPVKAWKRPADPADTEAATATKEETAAKAKAEKSERARKHAERQAKRDADEAARISKENEATAAAREKKAARDAERKAKRAKKKDKQVGASASASPSPGASPAPDAPKGKGKGKGKHEKGESKSHNHRDTDFKRTGEEAPIIVGADKRTTVAPVTQAAPYIETLKGILSTLIDGAHNPMERDLALAYLGYIGDKSRVAKMYEKVDDTKLDDGERLPVVAALIDGYDDKSRLPMLLRIADDPKAASFQKLWALEILAQAGDRSKIAVCQHLIDDPKTDANDRMRALTILAQVGDDSRHEVVAKIGRDSSLFQATRMQALACQARMEATSNRGTAEGTAELKKVMQKSHLSVEERLSIALDLCLLGDGSTREFLEHVVEIESDTIFDQLRALHGLALLGVSEHLGLLQDAVTTKHRPRNSARRILVMMGDRSRVADLLDDARKGDLEAVRTLVLAAVLDSGKGSATELLRQPRFKALIAP